ncbi:MAG: hypothetical protein ACSHX9_04290 [Luteolibacter sp.]
MSSHDPSRTTPGITLPALVAELRSRCEAVSRLQGGTTYYQEELGIFRSLAEEKSLYLDQAPPELSQPPDEEGNEHQVWYPKESRLVVKATWPDFFGMLVVHRFDEEPMASPIAYLERWSLHNQLFGDDVRFLGALQTDTGLRLLISQPAIAGIPATETQIQQFFADSGWLRFIIDGETAYFDPERRVVVSDTHRANLILMADGQLAPIDLRVQHLSGVLLDTVVRLCSS